MITQLVTKVICYSITFVVLTFVIKNIHMIRKNKLKKIKPKQIEAEWLIYNMKKKQIRPIRTEKAYNITKYNFNKALIAVYNYILNQDFPMKQNDVGEVRYKGSAIGGLECHSYGYR